MTCYELYDFASRLCDEGGNHVDDVKYYKAATSALRQVNALRPMERRVTVYHNPPLPSSYTRTMHNVPAGEPMLIPAGSDKSLAAWCTGSGTVSFVNEDGEPVSDLTHNWDEADCPSGAFPMGFSFPEHEGEIYAQFDGNVDFVLYGITYYREKFSLPRPYDYWTEYDMEKQVGPSFAGFACPPILNGETYEYLSDGYAYEGSRLLLQFSKPGVYDIWYRRQPNAIISKSETDLVDLDSDLAELLPYLTAYYMLLTEDMELAMMMKRRYDEMTLMIRRHVARATPYQVRGWK